MTAELLDIRVTKRIEELKGMDDVLFEPRAWSPEELREACKNVDIQIQGTVSFLEEAVIYFLIRHFFFIQHQTGLYNLQRKLWSLIAKAERIKIKRHKNPPWLGRDKYQISDIYLEDTSSGKYILARLVQPDSKIKHPAFKSLINMLPSRCLGVFYITDQAYTHSFLNKILHRTNFKDPIDRYRSPISKNCSLNLIYYSKVSHHEYSFELIHPNLDKKVEVSVNVSVEAAA